MTMEQNMIDRIADALGKAGWNEDHDVLTAKARAVLEAMCHPTARMAEAGGKVEVDDADVGPHPMLSEIAGQVWRAMIDEALSID